MLESDFFRKVIDETDSYLWYLIFYFQGEPYLHPEFTELVKYASSKRIYTATSTNAHYLTDANARKTVESGLDRLIISIDGTTQDVYQQYRIGGKLEKVLEGTKNIVKWKRELKSKTPHIIFQFLVVKPNEHQMQEVEKLAEELGVDEVAFKTAQVYEYENGNDLIPDNEHYSRYRKKSDGTYEIKNQLLNQCWKMWHSCVITWDGSVVPCCFDKDASHPMGNLQENTFKEVWMGQWADLVVRNINQTRDVGTAFFNKGRNGIDTKYKAIYAWLGDNAADDANFIQSYGAMQFLGMDWRGLFFNPNKIKFILLFKERTTR
jgi:MoaA/NifB/PqqE/SkfB family radical SAM enzyme